MFSRLQITKPQLKIMWLVTLFTAFLSGAFYIKGFESFFPYRVMMALHLILLVIYVAQQKHLRIPERLNAYYIALAAWLAWAFISLIWAENKGYGIRGLVLLCTDMYPLIFMPYYIDDEDEHANVIKIVIAAFIASITLAMIERLTGLHLPQSKANIYRGLDRTIPTAFYTNPNDFGAYLVMYLPIVYVMFKYAKKKAWWLYVIFSTGVSDLLAIASRAGDLALLMVAVAAVVLPILYNAVHKTKQSATAKVRTWVVWLTVILIIFANNYGITVNGLLLGAFERDTADDRGLEFGKQMESLLNFERNSSNSTFVRIQLIENGFKILNEKPVRYITGVGVGNIEEHMKAYVSTTNKTLNIHNWWFETLFDYGILALLAFIAFYLKILWELLKIYLYAEQERYRHLAEGLFLSVVAFWLASISPSSIVSLTSMWIIFAESAALIKSAALEARPASEVLGMIRRGKKLA